MKQGDFDMYCEPWGAFYPMDEDDASLILLHEFAESFSLLVVGFTAISL